MFSKYSSNFIYSITWNHYIIYNIIFYILYFYILYILMNFINEISKIVDKEKKRQSELEKKNIEKQKQNKILMEKKREYENSIKKYNEFLNNFQYGTISADNTNNFLKDTTKQSFEDCLKKAYTYDYNKFPYIGWESNNNSSESGYCYIGNNKNDVETLNYTGKNKVPVYITPVKDSSAKLYNNLSKRENIGKNRLIDRIKDNLDSTTRKLMYEKNLIDSKNEQLIKDNYKELNGLDDKILTTTQQIRDNTNRYILTKSIKNILEIFIVVIIISFVLMLTYFLIKYYRNIGSNNVNNLNKMNLNKLNLNKGNNLNKLNLNKI